VVAHFHYVLSMGAVFGLFAGFYLWFQKITGFFYSENLGRIHFYITFLGVNLTFFPMHFLGLAGMPRRIPDFPDAYKEWNFLCSIGAFLSLIGILWFFYVIEEAFSIGRVPKQLLFVTNEGVYENIFDKGVLNHEEEFKNLLDSVNDFNIDKKL